jgi:predicted metal-binding protein
MKPLEIYCEEALEKGLKGAKVIDPHSVVTAEWVRVKCQFGCPGFGRTLCCPPFSPTPEVTRKILDSYRKAILLHQQIKNAEKRREITKNFNGMVVDLELEVFLDGYFKAWSMGSGPCRLCKECDTQSSCKHGHRARPAMEACGIDVFTTARQSGFPIEVVRSQGDIQNIYGLILVE